MTQTLQQALEQLYGLERRRAKLGLDGTRALLGALGSPERAFRSVHVAGTNGKGSVCALVERVLRASGVRTGLFTSPHLVDFRERIRVAGRWADEDWLFETLRRIESLPESGEHTFFEVCTALGFGWFAAQRVEWAVVEVGLGGRLDTTNVLAPEVCVITGIGLDHTEILGDTIEAIAFEKAGIVKPGVPVVVGAGMDACALAVIRDVARARGAPLVETGDLDADAEDGLARWARTFGSPWGDDVEQPRAGTLEPRNLATALVTLAVLHRNGLDLPRAAVTRGLADARWPGRFESSANEPRLWWDGAHNPQGAAALARAWRRAALPPPAVLVVALSRDKDPDGICAALEPMASGARLMATRSRSERAMEPERIAAVARGHGFRAEAADTVAEGCARALAGTDRDAAPADAPVLLTGSLFAVGEAMEIYGGAPGEML